MTACGPDVQNQNFLHMWDFTDYRPTSTQSATYQSCVQAQNTLYGFIQNNPNFTKIKTLIDRAGMRGQLGDLQANFTLVVPSDNYLKDIPTDFWAKMDNGLAKQILGASLIDRRIGKNILQSSPVSYFYTKNPKMRMYVTNISGKTKINNCVTVMNFAEDSVAGEFINGLIHVIDGIIVPTEDHFMN